LYSKKLYMIVYIIVLGGRGMERGGTGGEEWRGGGRGEEWRGEGEGEEWE
jgi:hypothetical protein